MSSSIKKRSSDFRWIVLILLMLAGEIFWLLADMGILFERRSGHQGATEAGYVIRAKEDLKRRGSNSLIWENSKEKDVLYYHDSVLTLSQSSAALYLKDQTELHLSENTLVSIEEPDDKFNSEIRLRFSKGDLRARNPFANTAIHAEDWVVNVEKGSEIALKKGLESYELEVLSGRAQLQTEKGSETLLGQEIVRLGKDQVIEKISKSQGLRWKEAAPLRVYTFENEAQIPVTWEGRAKAVQISRSGEKDQVQEVASESETTALHLNQGSYSLRLKDEDGLSSAKEVEVWRAPRILLKQPLPRDRLQTNSSSEFVWTSAPEIKEYHLLFSGKKADVSRSAVELKEISHENYHTVQFHDEADLFWRVEAIDKDGYRIPAFYENPLYLREEPLAAPELKAPLLRKPAKTPEGASFLSPKIRFWQELFFGQKAQAESDDFEAVFEWKAVPGADLYVIEISSDPDFRTPEIMKTVKGTRYVWQKFKYAKYYWRVAAGTGKGRLGIFSPPTELRFEDIHKVVTAPPPPPLVEAEVKKTIVAEPSVAPAAIVEEVKPPGRELKSRWGFAWAPAYKATALKGNQNSQLQLLGASPLAFQMEWERPLSEEKLLAFDIWSTSQVWKPKPEPEYPFQDNLTVPETWVNSEIGDSRSESRWGLGLHQTVVPERKSDESIGIKSPWLVGPRWHGHSMGISLLTSGVVSELNFDFRFKKYFSHDDDSHTLGYYGIGGNLLYQSQKEGSGFQGNFLFLLGFDHF